LASPTIEEVKQEIKKQELKFPLVVLAQSIIEAGWHYESYNASVRNNLFGLWDSNNQRYFAFDNWRESVLGYKNMIQYRFREEKEGYYEFLKRIGYASDPNYEYKVRSIVKKLR
jgi:flagellum-specific peptidoglycan hydrolase FlgJ